MSGFIGIYRLAERDIRLDDQTSREDLLLVLRHMSEENRSLYEALCRQPKDEP